MGDFGPVPLVEARLVLGSLVLLPFLWRDRAQFSLRRLPMMALIGAINSALPFLLFAWAAERAPAGVGAIANGMTALCTDWSVSCFSVRSFGHSKASRSARVSWHPGAGQRQDHRHQRGLGKHAARWLPCSMASAYT